ncbi:MAG: PilZ domain-containing protein [Planctomycetota bacterium]|jgi:hypothetical protein
MEKADERRTEQRLRYRWTVRFAAKAGSEPLSGQMFDVSSKGMAFLFHANQSCPQPEDSIKASFGVPHFDSHGSFDTAFFNRVGRVCRVDNLNSRVNRVAVQFAEPLFFKPGEQDISEADALQRLAARAQAAAGTKDKVSFAKARRRTKAEEQARQKAKLHEEQMAMVKAEAAREIARIEAETAERIAEAKAEARAKLSEHAKAQEKSKKVARKSAKEGVVKKLDDFIKDRNKIY